MKAIELNMPDDVYEKIGPFQLTVA